MAELIYTIVPLVLVVIGLVFGRINERRHMASLTRREAAPGPTLTNLDHTPQGAPVASSRLCVGSVVIASDCFKNFGASLKTIIGGRLRTLESLLDRARREALQRMRERAAECGADIVLNVRLATSVIVSRKRNKGGTSVEVIAYGTAVRFAPLQDG